MHGLHDTHVCTLSRLLACLLFISIHGQVADDASAMAGVAIALTSDLELQD